MSIKNRELRILFITNFDLGLPGGELVCLVNLANSLAKRGNQVLFLAPFPRGIRMKPPKCLFVPCIRRRYIRYLTFILLYPFYLLYALFSFRPNIIIQRGSDVFSYFIAYLFSKTLKIPICLFHGWIPPRRFPFKWDLNYLLYYLHWLAWKHSFLIVQHNCPAEVERYANNESFPLSRLVIYDGPALDPAIFFPMDREKARENLGLPKESYILLFTASEGGAGNYNYEIMPRALKRIISKYPNSLLIIAGDIHRLYKKSFLKLIEEEGISQRVFITGYLSPEKLNLYINASDICLLPLSRKHLEESKISWATKIWEYFGCAKPVIKSDLEECWTYEWFKDISLIVPPDDEESLAQAIIQLLENPSLRKDLGERAYRWTLENHTWDKRAEKIERFLKGLVRERK